MKRKLQWRGPTRIAGGRYGYYFEGFDARNECVVNVGVTGKGNRALAKRIGDFLKQEPPR